MSVFTTLSDQDISTFISQFDVGALAAASGIPGGSENTNYFVECSGGHFVLTLVERGPTADLPFFIQLLDCLHRAKLPVPYAIRCRRGDALHTLKNKPALLQPRLNGHHLEHPGIAHCAALGSLLARLHGASCDLSRASDRDPCWVLAHAKLLAASTWRAQEGWLLPAISQLTHWLASQPQLPTTVIHGDLFRDNVLFTDHNITGVIDFYNAATGWPLLDLAICVNDWCIDNNADGLVINHDRVRALLAAYGDVRPLTAQETACWPLVLQLAALRFWVSRQQYALDHKGQAGVLIKDPDYFRQVMFLHVKRHSPSTSGHDV